VLKNHIVNQLQQSPVNDCTSSSRRKDDDAKDFFNPSNIQHPVKVAIGTIYDQMLPPGEYQTSEVVIPIEISIDANVDSSSNSSSSSSSMGSISDANVKKWFLYPCKGCAPSLSAAAGCKDGWPSFPLNENEMYNTRDFPHRRAHSTTCSKIVSKQRNAKLGYNVQCLSCMKLQRLFDAHPNPSSETDISSSGVSRTNDKFLTQSDVRVKINKLAKSMNAKDHMIARQNKMLEAFAAIDTEDVVEEDLPFETREDIIGVIDDVEKNQKSGDVKNLIRAELIEALNKSMTLKGSVGTLSEEALKEKKQEFMNKADDIANSILNNINNLKLQCQNQSKQVRYTDATIR